MSLLPKNWSTFSFDQIGGLIGGKTPSKSNSEFWGNGCVPWVSPKDMKQLTLTSSIDKISNAAVSEGGMELLPQESILIVTRSGILAHTLPIAISKIPVTINQDIKALRPHANLYPKFVTYNLLSHEQKILNECSKSGTTVASIETRRLEAFQFPLAPFPEQKRVAEKLDTVLARVDSCRKRLIRVPLILKRFRQSVLAAATSGQLTADWREQNDGLLDEVINSTIADGAKRWVSQSQPSQQTGWTKERAVDVCEKVQSGGTPKDGFISEPGVPFLKVYNIVDQKISFDYRPQYVTQMQHDGSLAKSKAKPGDVLMNIVGPPLGKVAVVPNTFPEWNINQAITLFRPSARITTGWLYAILCGGKNIAGVVNETRGSVGQINISLSQCRDFIFPVPSIKEQHEIVRRIEILFAFADRLEGRLATARAATDRLTPALLAKAFRGELVPQDPNDEPAAELLKRLAGARTAAADKPRRGRAAKVEKRP